MAKQRLVDYIGNLTEVTSPTASLYVPAVHSGFTKKFDLLKSLGWVDVRAYGAVGDGATDDTAAIQAAIDSGKPVLIPTGTFAHASTLTLPSTNGYLFGLG